MDSETLLSATPLRSQMSMQTKTPLTSKSVKRKRLQTIQAPELRIFQDLPEAVCEGKEKTMTTQTTTQSNGTQTTPAPSVPPESRRVSYGGRVQNVLGLLAAAAEPVVLVAESEAPINFDSINYIAAPVQTSCMSTSPMTVRAVSITAETMTSPKAASLGAETMTSPAQVHHASTSTSPPAAASAMVALMSSATPATLRGQVETLAISNEILRDNQLQLQRNIETAAIRENSLRQNAEIVRAEAEQTVAAARANIAQLSAALRDNEAIMKTTTQRLRELEARPTENPDDTAKLVELSQSLEILTDTIADLEAQLDQAHQAAEVARQAERTATTAAQAEMAKAEQHTHISKMLQDDLRMAYHRHKQELAALQQKYQHEAYASRYQTLVQTLAVSSSQASAMLALKPAIEEVALLEQQMATVLATKSVEIARREASIAITQQEMELESQKMAGLNDSLREELARTIGELSSTKDRMDEKVRAADDLANVCERLQAQLDEVLQRLQAAEDTTEFDQKIAALESQKSELLSQVEALDAGASAKDDELVQLRSEIDLLVEQKEMVEAALLQQQQAASAQENAKMKAENEALQVVIQQRDEYIAKLTEQVDEQARQHLELRDFIAEERLVRQEVIDDSEREANALRIKVSSLEEDLHAARQHIEDQVQQFEQQFQALQAQAQAAQTEKEQELMHIQTTLAQLGGELVDKELQAFEARAALAPMEKQLLDARLRFADFEKTIELKDTEFTKLKDYFKVYQERSEEKISTLQGNLAKAEAEVVELDRALGGSTFQESS